MMTHADTCIRVFSACTRSFGSGYDTNAGWIILFYNGGLWANVADGTHVADINTGTNVQDGVWHALVFVVDRSGGGVATTLYVDGVAVGSSSSAVVGNINSAYPFIAIGQDATLKEGGGFTHVQTAVDEVRVWNTALSSADVLSSAVPLCVASQTSPPSVASLLVWLRFQDGYGGAAVYAGSSGGAAYVFGSSVWTTDVQCTVLPASASPVATPSVTPTPTAPSPSPSPSSVAVAASATTYTYLSATTDYVTYAKVPALSFTAATSFTVALYVRTTQLYSSPILATDMTWTSYYWEPNGCVRFFALS